MIKWISNLFSPTKTENNTDCRKSEALEHQKNNIENVSNKFLIIGLGNIGAEYVNTRHNIGFKIVDFLARKESVTFETVKLGTLAQYKFKGRTFLLLKPNTYMNLSGKAVQYWMGKENIPLENILVITDDLNLSFGAIRIRQKGSDGGHNGLKNINLVLNTQNYARFRFGISDEFKKGKQVDYVLGDWDDTEKTALTERLELASEIIKSFGTSGLEITMTTFNGK
ncbi:aminoacyl-tRNA hydrolase [Flavobacterium sp. LS1P28]|uniref:aminoacyl-tRNA hydrolase n=1 Tax=unclassified Flavobacterium TaxID=196869 RepID=UPI000F816DD4|nr:MULTISPECIES: aminoacyl-tRNA hydrolase [unclassified Flavobacterium]RTY65595.1 aminoacyl-tRNA hydrolase [Flavobacterium sp. LB2P53]RTY76528.1 aminoacyl-tRNA hydrolase [Flavobacterium sp. LS1R10]RTY84073.1 aminoacyl-tRNA hydrolase [Flavobacterium sp. LS1P28]RTY92824.1 aminoacyl-tRNA hydrolase [Flavobacterium sp. RSP46]